MSIFDNDPLSGLTGRRRYRDTEHGLILQVEKYFWAGVRWECDWCDAASRDVMKAELV